MEKILIHHWGRHKLEDMTFYIEPNSEDYEVGPFKLDDENMPCPHSGLNSTNFKNWKKVAYVDDNSLTAKRIMKLIPKNLSVVGRYTFFHAKYMPAKSNLLKYLNMTNAIPVFIYGIDNSVDFDKLLSLVQLEVPRPVYFSGQSDVPVPVKIKRYKERKRN